MKSEGEVEFSNLTAELFPCGEAYEAVTTMTAVTCGDQGAINRVTGVIYVLSLTILFTTFFYFSLFNLAFVQAVQIRRLSGDFARRSCRVNNSDGRTCNADYRFSGWPEVLMRWVATTGRFVRAAVDKPMITDQTAV